MYAGMENKYPFIGLTPVKHVHNEQGISPNTHTKETALKGQSVTSSLPIFQRDIIHVKIIR